MLVVISLSFSHQQRPVARLVDSLYRACIRKYLTRQHRSLISFRRQVVRIRFGTSHRDFERNSTLSAVAYYKR